MQLFPTVNLLQDGSFDREYLKCIGIVVFKGFVDAENGNKVRFEPVESFVGELKKDAKNSVTGASKFIDDIVNTNSNYIEVYSNCFNATATSEKETVAASAPLTIKTTMLKSTKKSALSSDADDVKEYSLNAYSMPFSATPNEASDSIDYDAIDIFYVQNLSGFSIGFVENTTNKKVSAKSIFTALDKVFDKTKNINERQIDLVVDAGIANIA